MNSTKITEYRLGFDPIIVASYDLDQLEAILNSYGFRYSPESRRGLQLYTIANRNNPRFEMIHPDPVHPGHTLGKLVIRFPIETKLLANYIELRSELALYGRKLILTGSKSMCLQEESKV